MKSILFFGDSLTAGYGLRNASLESYPALIEKKIADAQLDYKVINAGLSGDTSAGGLNRVDYWTSQPVHAFVLELGVNDIIRGISPATILFNLQSIINKVTAKHPGVKMALMGMKIPPFLATNFSGQFNAIYDKLALDNKIAFVPFFLKDVAGKDHLNLPDHLHPSAEGYKIIANNVWPVIKSLL